MRIPVPLGFPYSQGRSKAAGMGGLVNMYGEEVKYEGKTKLVLYGTAGRLAFATIGGGSVRGQINTASNHYAVVGTRFYSVSSLGTTNDIGEIEGTAMVDMAFDGQYVFVVAELKSYTFDTVGLTLSEVTDGDFVQASSATGLSAYIIVTRKDTGQFAWSNLLAAPTWDPLDYATAESEPDKLVAVRKRGNEIALLGTNSTEFWGLTGDSLAPFARVNTQAATIGCLARDSAVLVDNGLMWVGRDGLAGGVSVYRAEGYIPKKITGPNEDVLLEAVADPSTLRAFAYQQAGHQFYVLTSPQEFTIAWDVATGQWSHRRTGDFTMGADPTGAWDCITFALNGSKQIVGSDNGNLYQLDLDTLTDASSTLVREVTCPQLWSGGSYRSMDRLELEIQTGVGLITGQGSDPLVMESHSDDGGSTWSTPRTASMGVMGNATATVFWTRLGQYKNRIIKFRVTDPVTTVFLNAWAEVS